MRHRREDMCANPVFLAFQGETSRESCDAGLRRSVVALAEVAIQSTRRRRVDDAATRTSLLHVVIHGEGHAVRAF